MLKRAQELYTDQVSAGNYNVGVSLILTFVNGVYACK